ncbi:hypothetical protein EJ06DRAFT_292721 [Trichodelitschia bisporula]|uniref:Uncharacterized protein n=1 Tax=Trichodelitschia bisporula TaxID=703511 RepID=A0A6G1I6E4_9PEZI|nr:hypothetical protein EJ06DRAFT_292721 [Trichodelitschia bisporula]
MEAHDEASPDRAIDFAEDVFGVEYWSEGGEWEDGGYEQSEGYEEPAEDKELVEDEWEDEWEEDPEDLLSVEDWNEGGEWEEAGYEQSEDYEQPVEDEELVEDEWEEDLEAEYEDGEVLSAGGSSSSSFSTLGMNLSGHRDMRWAHKLQKTVVPSRKHAKKNALKKREGKRKIKKQRVAHGVYGLF